MNAKDAGPPIDGVCGDQEVDGIVKRRGAWDASFPFEQDEFVRVVASCLQGLGYKNAAKVLEEESGHHSQSQPVSSLLEHVVEGRWEEALAMLPSVQFTPPPLHEQARALLLRHHFLELVEDKRLEEALNCLRNELAPLSKRGSSTAGKVSLTGDVLVPDQLHALSMLLMAQTSSSLRRMTSSSPVKGKKSSRMRARSEAQLALQSILAEGGKAIAPMRLQKLVSQGLQLQSLKCPYHNREDPKPGLSKDHSCKQRVLPQMSTHVLDEHKDEVWCCAFSNNGKMLATASCEGTLLLWNVEGVIGAHPRAPTLHKRIPLRDGPPNAIAWSPDDSSILACCADSTVVRRWKISNGAEDGVYRGQHQEGVSEIAWLPDGQAFVSAGLDRNLIVWGLDGTIRAVWNGKMRITGIAIALHPPSKNKSPPFGTAGSRRCDRRANVQNGSRSSSQSSSPSRSAYSSPASPGSVASPNNGKVPFERCRVWAVCRENTIKAIDIDVKSQRTTTDAYGLEGWRQYMGGGGGSASGSVGGRGSRSGTRRSGARSRRHSDDTHDSIDLTANTGSSSEEDNRVRRRRRNGVVSFCLPASSVGGKEEMLSIVEGPEEVFPGVIISGISISSTGEHLLLHIGDGRILCWDAVRRNACKR